VKVVVPLQEAAWPARQMAINGVPVMLEAPGGTAEVLRK
jgi:hypothetical protein